MDVVKLLVVTVLLSLSCCVSTQNSNSQGFNFAGLVNVNDYIVVGAGAAGCVVANRLSEDPTNKVLIIEAGGPSHRSLGGTDYVASSFTDGVDGELIPGVPFTRYDIPLYQTTTQAPPSPTPHWKVINDQPNVSPWSQTSKIVGGSMVHNGMGWLRGTLESITGWGMPTTWNASEVLRYYRKSENVTGSKYETLNPGYHGLTGPVQISEPAYLDPSSHVFYNACVSLGHPENPDVNGPTRYGCGYNQYNIRRGVRDSTANAHLAPALATRTNLHLLDFAQVTKVIFWKPSLNEVPQAIGVEYVKNGFTRRAYAKKEVILAAGGLHTPKLLLLSGIGPQADLEALNIETIVNNPAVGNHMRNHHVAVLTYEYPMSGLYPNTYSLGAATIQWGRFGTGIMAAPRTMSYAFLKSSITEPEPDIWINVNPGTQAHRMNIAIATTAPLLDKGTVKLSSSNPFDPILLSPNAWYYQADVTKMVNAIKLTRTLMSATQLISPGFFGAEVTPGPSYQTDAQLEQWVREKGTVQGHWSSTARMGNDGASNVVLDPRLRVLGVTRLRVADAAAIPGMVNGQIQSTVVALAEKAADLILEDN